MRVFPIIALVLIGAAAGWFFTRPQPIDPDRFAGLIGNPDAGETIFAAAGCASCHADPNDPSSLVAGGRAFDTPYGTFFAPNISNDPEHGVGRWSDLELASAIMAGVGKDTRHLYPAFPYTAYNKAAPQDVLDLITYMRTLPGSDRPSEAHRLSFPYNLRAGIGAWKLLYLNEDWVLAADSVQMERGRYLVEALGHCAECHTPRNALGALDHARWMAGAPNPSGEGQIPNITPAALTWSVGEISEYLLSGFTPAFDVAGGSMAAVIRNTSRLSDEDREAIAVYLKAVPQVEN
ncbi:c-type cytochrome [Yoonia litorea]|uniref:Cytochrome c, mono-and diheme variants n=1 Tax=Yoonia litorea TaxID=1123755 RepID=A0A1I6M2K2_9RHOB|nr:cytochrome c [Yoonia litorea]SFS09894.1 Cytochrome c, mono-and diheme variants [Yoonia litorea]